MPNYTYSFTITVMSGGYPVSGVSVTVNDPWHGSVSAGSTSPSGTAGYSNTVADTVTPGDYNFVFDVSHPNYLPASATKTVKVNRKASSVTVTGTSTLGFMDNDVAIELIPITQATDVLNKPPGATTPGNESFSIMSLLLIAALIYFATKK